MIYANDAEIVELVERFEAGMVIREQWSHAAHLTVAPWYAQKHDSHLATAKMRAGIFNLLNSFGVDLTKEMPYHETLTVFWMKMVFDYLEKTEHKTSLSNLANNLIETCGDSGLPLKFYSRDVLFSAEARAKYLKPDL